MAKNSSKYYSVAVSHPELPGAYLSSFAIPGSPPEWIMEGRSQKIFTSPESAEIAGFRAMMARMNLSSQAQNFIMRNPTRVAPLPTKGDNAKTIQQIRSNEDAKKVFSKFGKTGGET